MVSHRSGETEDNFIADLSVGLASGQVSFCFIFYQYSKGGKMGGYCWYKSNRLDQAGPTCKPFLLNMITKLYYYYKNLKVFFFFFFIY